MNPAPHMPVKISIENLCSYSLFWSASGLHRCLLRELFTAGVANAIMVAKSKTAASFGTTVVRGLLCNWLVRTSSHHHCGLISPPSESN